MSPSRGRGQLDAPGLRLRPTALRRHARSPSLPLSLLRRWQMVCPTLEAIVRVDVIQFLLQPLSPFTPIISPVPHAFFKIVVRETAAGPEALGFIFEHPSTMGQPLGASRLPCGDQRRCRGGLTPAVSGTRQSRPVYTPTTVIRRIIVRQRKETGRRCRCPFMAINGHERAFRFCPFYTRKML